MSHLKPEQLRAFREGRAVALEALEHLVGCSECQSAFEDPEWTTAIGRLQARGPRRVGRAPRAGGEVSTTPPPSGGRTGRQPAFAPRPIRWLGELVLAPEDPVGLVFHPDLTASARTPGTVADSDCRAPAASGVSVVVEAGPFVLELTVHRVGDAPLLVVAALQRDTRRPAANLGLTLRGAGGEPPVPLRTDGAGRVELPFPVRASRLEIRGEYPVAIDLRRR